MHLKGYQSAFEMLKSQSPMCKEKETVLNYMQMFMKVFAIISHSEQQQARAFVFHLLVAR